MFMPNFSKNEVVLVRYPFSDLTSSKVRPAVVVNAAHTSQDLFVVALTSKTSSLLSGEFILAEWKAAGLNVETAVKRGIFTIKETLVRKRVGKLEDVDAEQLKKSLRAWLGLP
jgi:mRNA interferase MazF